MAGPSEAQLRKLWRVGVPVAKAWITYAHPEQKAYWDSLQKPFALQALVEGLATGAQAGLSMPESLQNIAAASKPVSDARNEMQAAILRHIKAGKLYGIGYEPPRKLASAPVMLPKGIWAGKIDWDKSAVSGAGLSFIEVRLTTSRYLNEIYVAKEAARVASLPVKGRPSVAPHITTAVQALLAAGQIDPARSAKSHFPAIRAWLTTNALELSIAPSDIHNETIRQHFAPIFNDLKKTNKQ